MMAADINITQWTTTLAPETTTSNSTPLEIHWSPKVITQISITIVVMIMTLIGNVTLILTITCNKDTRKRRISIFLINLALGDLTVCVVTMSTEIIFVAFGEWVLGPVACKLTVYGQVVTLASSTFLLTAMSIDRYQVIVKPLRTLTHRPKIWKKVAVAWILSLIFASPQLFIFVQVKVTKSDGRELYKCLSRGYTEPEWQRKVYMTFLASYVLFVPTVIMTYCYTKIMQTLWNRGRGGSELRNRIEMRISGRTDLVRNSKRKAVKLSLVVIFGFLLCWTPYFVVSLIRIYSNYSINLNTVLDFSEKMALVHSALNPIIYGLFNVNFNKIYGGLKTAKGRFAGCCGNKEAESLSQDGVVSSVSNNENHVIKSSLPTHQIENNDVCTLHHVGTDETSSTCGRLPGGDICSQRRETIPLLDTERNTRM